MATKADIRTAVLRHLGVIAANETPNAADAETVEDVIDRQYASMQASGIAYWGSNDYPDHVAQNVIQIVANLVGPQFGVPPNDRQLLRSEADSAYRRLIGQTAVKDSGMIPVKGNYF